MTAIHLKGTSLLMALRSGLAVIRECGTKYLDLKFSLLFMKRKLVDLPKTGESKLMSGRPTWSKNVQAWYINHM